VNSNPEVRDTVARLCANTSDLIPKFLLPVIGHQLAAGGPFTRSAAVVAGWARYAEGTDENSETYEMDDVLAPQLRAAAGRQHRHPTAFLEDNRAVFGDLADDTRFTRVYSSILTALLDGGVRKTFADLDHYATGGSRPD
jgi:mannitol 2-dehydrogenase